MSSTKNPKDEAFQNLLIEIKLYLKSKDTDSLQYLLEGQDQSHIKKIRQKLSTKQKALFDETIQTLATKNHSYDPQIKNQTKIKAALPQQKQQSDDEVLQKFEKQYKVTDIVYGQNYSYPFISLLEKMSSIYFYKSHPNPFPQASLKMLHSLIETLFSYVFDKRVRENYESKKHHNKKSFHNYMKQYLFFVFEKEYQKFASFHKLFKTIKSSISQKQITEEDLHLHQSKTLEHSPLTSTQNLQELEYFQKISGQIKNEAEFKEYSKIKTLNFLYFGQKRIKQLIDPDRKFLIQNVQKQILQLISFVLCRFVRKVILRCIKSKNNGKLSGLSHTQNIEPVDVKIHGNAIIDQYHKKVECFLKLDEPLDQIAKRTFLQQFYQYDYERFIPKTVIEQSAKKIELEKSSMMNLPKQVWLASKYYQSLWIQRVAAEEFVRQNYEQPNLKREKGKNNEYSKFIRGHLKQFEQNCSILWIKYLTTIHKDQLQQCPPKQHSFPPNEKDNPQSSGKSKKRIKLQSLSN